MIKMKREHAAPPSTSADQSQQRSARRRSQLVEYGAAFDLATEVEAIVGPLAAGVAAKPNAEAYAPAVRKLADAVAELVAWVCAERAVSDARERIAAAPIEDRKRIARAVRALAPHPVEPVIGPDSLTSGEWGDALVSYAGSQAEALSGLLGRARPASQLRGLKSRSDHVVDHLRAIDAAARGVERALDRAVEHEIPDGGPRQTLVNDRRARERAEHAAILADAGIDLTN